MDSQKTNGRWTAPGRGVGKLFTGVGKLFTLLGVICLPLSLSVVLSGCLSSDAPLSNAQNAKPDDGITGVWHETEQQNDVYLHIIPDSAKPWYRLVRVTHIKVGGNSELEDYKMFLTESGADHFANIMVPKPTPEKKQQGTAPNAYCFVRYKLMPDGTLKVWMIDDEKLKAAVDSHKLKGRAWDTTWDRNIVLEDTSDNILKYLQSPDAGFKDPAVFRRVVDAPLQAPAEQK